MKTYCYRIVTLCLLSLVFWSCEKDEDKRVATPGTPPALSVSQSAVVLKEEDKDRDAVTLSWTKSNFGLDAAVRYTLQFDKKGNNFAKAKEVEMNNVLLKTYKVSELNGLANDLKLTGFVANDMEVRLRAAIGERFTPVYSNVLTISTTPYLAEPEYPTLYMVGAATEFAWDNTQGTPMFRDETDAFVFTFTGNLQAGALKFLGFPGRWAPQFGNNGSGGLQLRATDSDPDPGAFTVGAPGYYTVRVSLRDNTFSLSPYDASGATLHNSIGIIGAFNGWSDIVPMTKSALNPHTWKLDYTFAAPGELKFRIAPSWDVNWGTKNAGPDGKIKLYGRGTLGGDNLTLEAGTYTILFNDLTGQFVFVKK